jgi:hypothetical protein
MARNPNTEYKTPEKESLRKTTKMLDLVSKSRGTFLAPREVIQSIVRLAPEAVNTLEELMRNAKADSVRLKAAMEILALSGLNKETHVKITTEVSDLDDSEINDRLHDLLGTAAGVVLDGEARDVTPTPTDEEDNDE